MDFTIVPASDVPLSQQAAIANQAFAGYVGGWHEMDAEALARFLCLQGSDLYYSRFLRVGNDLAGFGYINRTGNILRLSGMAIVPEARGAGAAAHLLIHLLDEAKNRGDTAIMLEVIEQNPRAHAFYRRHGFRELSHLLGWRRSGQIDSNANATQLEASPILDALIRPTPRDYPDLPWQISRHAIAKVERTCAFRFAKACVIIGDPQSTPIRIHGLFPGSSDWDDLRAGMAAVLRRFPDGEFFAPAIWPEEFGREIFEPLGFTREPLTQFLMRRDLP